VSSLLPVALMALAGVLVGGAWSVHRQGAGRGPVVVLGALAAVSLAAGILWLLPEAGR
jgi:hypothetical protein